MNVFCKVAFQGLRRNRTRTLVTIVGVALSAALVTAALTFGISLLDYAAAGAAQRYGGWHTAFLGVDGRFCEERAQDDEAADVFALQNIGYARLADGQNADKPYLFLTGFDQKAFDSLPLILLSGRLPENGGEAIIPSHVSSVGGVEFDLGDTLNLSVGSRMRGAQRLTQHDPYAPDETFAPEATRTYTVVGTYGRPAFEETAAPGYTVITRTDSRTPAESLSAFVTLKSPRGVHAYAQRAAGGHATLFNDEVLRFMGLASGSGDNVFSALLLAIATVVVSIIMVGSIFLIYNAFSISLSERMQQIGILASVGATARQIRGSVLFEGLCIGAAGIPLGVLIGLLGIRIVIAVVAANFGSILYSGVTLTLHVTPLAIAAAVVISLITILLSAYIPARKAAGMPVMECIRQTNEVKVGARTVRTSRLTQRLFGLEGTLAVKNFKRNRRRYRSIVFSLVLSVVLFISASAFVGDLEQVMAQSIAFTTYDVGLEMRGLNDTKLIALYEDLLTAPGVTGGNYQEITAFSCSVDAADLADAYWDVRDEPPADGTVELPVEVQFLDEDTYRALLEEAGLPVEAYTGAGARWVAVAKLQTASGEKQGEKEAADFRDLFQPGHLETTLTPTAGGEPDRAHAFRAEMTLVEAVSPDIPPTKGTSAYSDQNVYYFNVIAPWSRRAELAAAGIVADVRTRGMTFTSGTPGQSAAEMKARIQAAGVTSAYSLLNMSQVLEENRNFVFIADVFAYTFILMISLIAAANVFNTVSTNIRLRRRELAMLRSVGMSEPAFNRMMRFECALYGLRALAIGLPLSVLCAYLIYRGMFAGGGEGIVFELPLSSMGISILCVLLVIFTTMAYAVSRIRKENIIDALRDEMT